MRIADLNLTYYYNYLLSTERITLAMAASSYGGPEPSYTEDRMIVA